MQICDFKGAAQKPVLQKKKKKKKKKKYCMHVDNWLLSVNMIVLAALTLGFILWHFAHAALIHVSTPLKYSPMMSHKFFDSVA